MFAFTDFQSPPLTAVVILCCFPGPGWAIGVAHLAVGRSLPFTAFLAETGHTEAKASFAFFKQEPLITSVSARWQLGCNCS